MLASTDVPASEPRTDMTDGELMLAYAAGDAGAFDTLYARHEQAFYRFVQRLLSTRLAAEVDEVFQEVWVRIVTARAEFSIQGPAWRRWAFAIAHDLVMNRLRASGRDTRLVTRVVAADENDIDGDEEGKGAGAQRLASLGGGVAADMKGHPGDAMDARARAEAAYPSTTDSSFWRSAGRRLLACLNELPDEQRAAFLLHHEEGFTDETLAALLGVDSDTVRSRLRSASKALRACMPREGDALEKTA